MNIRDEEILSVPEFLRDQERRTERPAVFGAAYGAETIPVSGKGVYAKLASAATACGTSCAAFTIANGETDFTEGETFTITIGREPLSMRVARWVLEKWQNATEHMRLPYPSTSGSEVYCDPDIHGWRLSPMLETARGIDIRKGGW